MPNQEKIILAANHALHKNSIVMRLNNKGTCAGLSGMYIRYFVNGEEEEFFKLAKRVSALPKDYRIGQQPELDRFIVEAYEGQTPLSEKTSGLQGRLEEFIAIGKQQIRAELSVGTTATEEDWVKFFEKLKQNEGKSFYIAAQEHAIAIGIRNGEFHVYDPNYNEDLRSDKINNTKVINDANTLVAELIKCFEIEHELVSLEVRAFGHPQSQIGKYPERPSLPVNSAAWSRQAAIEAVLDAISANDMTSFNLLLKKFKQHEWMLEHVILKQNDKIAYQLYEEVSLANQLETIKKQSHQCSPELLTRMLTYLEEEFGKTHTWKSILETLNNNTNAEPSLLANAALATNPENLSIAFEFYKKHGLNPNINLQPAFSAAISEGNLIHTKALLAHWPNIPKALLLDVVKEATSANQTEIMSILIPLATGSKEAVQDFKKTFLSAEILANVNNRTLALLSNAGVEVSDQALPIALANANADVFTTALQSQPKSALKDQLQCIMANDESLIAGTLMTAYGGITVFQVLCYCKDSQKNALIKKHFNFVDQDVLNASLRIACQYGNEDVAAFLVAKGAKLDLSTQLTMLKQGLETGNLDLCDAVIASKPIFDNDAIENNTALINRLFDLGDVTFIFDSMSLLKFEIRVFVLELAILHHNNELVDLFAEHFPLAVAAHFINHLNQNNFGEAAWLHNFIKKYDDARDAIEKLISPEDRANFKANYAQLLAFLNPLKTLDEMLRTLQANCLRLRGTEAGKHQAAIQKVMARLQGQAVEITAKDIKIINNLDVKKSINQFLAQSGDKLAQMLGYSTPIHNLETLANLSIVPIPLKPSIK